MIKPLDREFLDSVSDGAVVVTVEDGIVRGGFGESVRSYFAQTGKRAEVVTAGYDDKFIDTLSETAILESGGLTTEALKKRIRTATGIEL